MRLVVSVFVAAAVALGAARASAQTVASDAAPPSLELVRQGIAARREGNDARAVELFRRAQQLDPRPMVTAQLALALQATGSWEEAERTLTTALASATDPWIAGHREILEEAARTIASHLCSLEITGTPASAQVFVNGAPAGTLPLAAPLRLRTGTVNVELRAEGFYTQERRVELVAGERFREQFALIERPRDTGNAGRGVDRSIPRIGVRVVDGGTTGTGATRSVTRSIAPRVPVAAISITAGGAVVAVVGAIVTGVGASRVGAIRERCASTDLASTEALECPDDRSILAARDEADSMLVAGQVLAIVGGATAVAGAVYWALSTRREQGRVVVAPTASGVVVGGVF